MKSTNSQLRIFSTNFLGKEGIPLPREISVEDFPTEDRAAANKSCEDEAPTDSGRTDDELELSEAPAVAKVAVLAGNDPASVAIKGKNEYYYDAKLHNSYIKLEKLQNLTNMSENNSNNPS